MVETIEQEVNLIVLKIKKNNQYDGSFGNHLGKSIVPIGSKFITDEKINVSDSCEVAFVVDDENNSDKKHYFISRLHELISINQNNPLQNHYAEIAVDYYSLDDMKTVYVVKNLQEVTKKEFSALLGKYYQYNWYTESGSRKKFDVNMFLTNRPNRVYLSE